MHRAFSFPVTLERSRTKERLEASLAGLCELELRKQRQECLVLGALALGDPPPLQRDPGGGELSCFSSWGQENLTLRRQLSALQSSPWGLMQALEQQVGELRIETDGGGCDGAPGDAGDSRPSSGFYESSEGQSPKGRSCCAESSEAAAAAAACPWAFTNDRPKSVGDPLSLNGEGDAPVLRATLPRSFSAPYPPLEGIAEEGPAVESWQWDPSCAEGPWQQQQDPHPPEGPVSEEDYQQALRVETYIAGLVQRHTLPPRPCQPRTTLSPDPPYCGAPGYASSLHRRTPSLGSEPRLPDPHLHPQLDLSANANVQARGRDPLEGEPPSLEEDCYLALPHPQCRPHSLAGRLPSPLPPPDPNCVGGGLNLCCEPSSPQHYLHPQPPPLNLVSAHYIPGQACHAPVRSPRHYNPEQPKPHRAGSPPDHQGPASKSRTSKKNHNERQRSKKSSSKTRSQSENSLLAQRVLPERRYSTTERRPGRGEAGPSHGVPAAAAAGGHDGSRRWCSNLELSQDEGEPPAEHGQRRAPRKVRRGHSCPYSQPPAHLQHPPPTAQRWHSDFQERAPLCRGEEGYAAAGAPAESESSMSEVYSPGSSSLSSDSDESGGLVWPQQLPPRLAATSSSSSSPSPQANANPPAQPKAFVKIKASHALKKKILRFRSGSLKVMTTV